MNRRRLPVPVTLLLIIGLIIGGYLLIRSLITPKVDKLVVSGTIEAVNISIAPEVSGKVLNVFFSEGNSVKVGDVLFELDPGLLQAQRAVTQQNLELAKASLASAEAQLALVKNSVEAESATARTADWFANNPGEFQVPGGTFSQADLITAANNELTTALQAKETLQTTLTTTLEDPAAADFKKAEMDLLTARAEFLTTNDVLEKAKLTSNNDLINMAQKANDSARSVLEDAQNKYDDLKGSTIAKKIIRLRIKLTSAQERVDVGRDNLLKLQYGDYSPRLSAAMQTVEQAKVSITQVESQLALIDLQISKLTVNSPTDGTVITRSIQPGEIISAGATALTIANLAELELTVYIPEDLYGSISIGQTATIKVDSYPDESFTASVVAIADQAEFTPRNVQTVEGRKTTVFAIKLRVENTSGKLKPGMPADVTFD